MLSRQAQKKAVQVARQQLAERLARPPSATDMPVQQDRRAGCAPEGPPPPRSDQEAVERLRSAKRIENESWLRRLGLVLWCATCFAAAVSLGAVHVENQGPAAARQVEALSGSAQEAVDDLRLVLDEQGERLDAEARTATAEIGTELTEAATALGRRVDDLPGAWLGSSLASEKRDLSAAATQLSTVAGELAQPAPDVGRQDVETRVAQAAEVLRRIDRVDASPGTTWPWRYERETAAAFVYAVLLTLVALAMLSGLLRKSGGLRFFLVGGDGRLSTSQTQAALWTVALFFLLAHLLLRPDPGDFSELDQNYLLLLGGPYAAWVVSGAVTRGKLDEKVLQKVTADEAQAKDLVADDNGRASLVDAQFFLFSMLALIGVLVAFAQEPSGLPVVDPALAMLSGAAAVVYTGKKSLDRNAPTITSVTRSAGQGPITSGTEIVVHGANFVPPGGGGDLDVLTGVVVRFAVGDAVVEQPVRPTLPASTDTAPEVREAVVNPSPERLVLVVPPLPPGHGTVRVITASGAQTAEHPLHISAPEVVVVPAAEQEPPAAGQESRAHPDPGSDGPVDSNGARSPLSVP